MNKKHFFQKILIFSFLVVATVSYLVFVSKSSQVNSDDKEMQVDKEVSYRETEIQEFLHPDEMLFSEEDIQMGETVGNMILVSKESWKSVGYILTFEGKAVVEGEFSIDIVPAIAANQVCFSELTNASLAQLPKATYDGREVSFCLEDTEKVLADFPSSGGKAKIEIDSYVIRNVPTSTWNTAELINVISF